MINITNKRAKQLYLAEMTRMMTRLENIQARQLKPVLNKQYLNAASLVRQGVLLEAIDYVVDNERKRLFLIFAKHYRRVATTFSNKTYKVIEDSKKFIIVPDIKGPKDEFWTELNRWTRKETASKVTGIQKTSRKLLAKTIQKGMNEGLSNHAIAKNLVKNGRISTPFRAKTIAITETHTAAVKSVDAAIRSTRIEMEKEWVPNIDKRTRPDHVVMVNHPRVPEGGKFRVGSSSMEYPGDPAGGGDQVIRCRCVLMYHTVKRTDKLKPYVPEREMMEFSDMAVEKFTIGEGFSKVTEKKLTKDFQSHLSDMLSRNSVLKRKAGRASVKSEIVINKGKIWVKGKEKRDGLYFQRKIQVNGAVRKKESLKIGKGTFHVGEDRLSIFRHEYGHYTYDELLSFKEKTRFNNFYMQKNVRKSWFKKNVSVYAGTNGNEAFAETFSAYTSPKYKKGFLPKKLEVIFDEFFGGK